MAGRGHPAADVAAHGASGSFPERLSLDGRADYRAKVNGLLPNVHPPRDNFDRMIRPQLFQNLVGFSNSEGSTSRASANRTNSRSVTHRTWDSTLASVSRLMSQPDN